jgi:hypothetical protein
MARTTGRIVISQNVEEMLTLASKVYQRHQDVGEASPLTNLDGISWSVVGPTIEQALDKQKEAEEYKNRMEQAYRERDLYTPAIKEAVTASRNLLKALNQKNPKRLAEWGFDVDDSAQTAKTPKAE